VVNMVINNVISILVKRYPRNRINNA